MAIAATAKLPTGTHLIEVEATDVTGKLFVDRETFRVIDIAKPVPSAPNAAARPAR